MTQQILKSQNHNYHASCLSVSLLQTNAILRGEDWIYSMRTGVGFRYGSDSYIWSVLLLIQIPINCVNNSYRLVSIHGAHEITEKIPHHGVSGRFGGGRMSRPASTWHGSFWALMRARNLTMGLARLWLVEVQGGNRAFINPQLTSAASIALAWVSSPLSLLSCRVAHQARKKCFMSRRVLA